MADGGGYYVNLTGRVVPVPADQEGAAIDAGFVPASKEQVKDLKLQEKFGTPGQQLATGLEAGAEALTLGVSDYAEKALGVPAQDIAGREAANPAAHAVGTGVGIIAPTIASFGAAGPLEGASAVRGAAELSAPSLISRAGGAASRAVGEALPEATTLGGKVARGFVQHAASGAVEGGLYGAGHVVHEDALGDPNLTAQSAMDEIGTSALLGGTLTGTLGATGGAISHLAGKLKTSQLAEKMSGWLENFEAERALKTAGAIQGDISKAEGKLGPEGVRKLALEGKDMGIIGDLDTPAAVLEKAQAAKEAAGEEIGGIGRRLDAEFWGGKSGRDLVDELQEKVVQPMLEKPFQRAAGERLGGILNEYAAKFGDSGAPGFQDLHQLRMDLGDELYGLAGDKSPASNYATKALKKAYGAISEHLDAMAEVADSKDAWQLANRRYQVASQIEKFAEKGVQRAAGNNLVSPTEFLALLAGGMHSGPMGILAGLGTAAARRFGSGALGAGARVVRGLLDKEGAEAVAGATAEAVAASRQAGNDAVAQAATHAPESVAALSQLQKANRAAQERIKGFVGKVLEGSRASAQAATMRAMPDAAEKIGLIHQLAQSPEMMHGRLSGMVSDVHEHAPNTAMALQTTSARAVAFLAQKAPKPVRPGPLSKPLQASRQETWVFERYYNAVERPTSILEHASAGTLTPMDVEAVRTVFPALYSSIQTAAIGALVEHKGEVPYRSKLMLSLLLGQDLDGTMKPQAILANQAIYQMPSQKSPLDQAGPGALRPTAKGADKLKGANRVMLPGQSADVRRGEL